MRWTDGEGIKALFPSPLPRPKGEGGKPICYCLNRTPTTIPMIARVPLGDWQDLQLSETEEEAATRLLKTIKARGGPKLPHEKPH